MQLSIKTERLWITILDESMAESVHLNSLDDDNRRFMPDEVFETMEDARGAVSALVANYSRRDTALVYPILLHDGRNIGHVQAVPIAEGWEIGYHVAKPFTGNGYAAEAVNAFLPVIMNRLGITRISGVCRADNTASRRVLKKCGFALVHEGPAQYHGEECLVCRYDYTDGPDIAERMDDFFNARAGTYDSHMLGDLKLYEFYEAIDACFDAPVTRLLDLGCGTGLELERLFARFPDMSVTGIDMSAEMLSRLVAKYPGKKMKLLCGSYFDEDFAGTYAHALSTYSLHHFTEGDKLTLYKKIYDALEPDGVFVFGDYTVPTEERQREGILAAELKRREQNIPDGEFYHIDIPFTARTEVKLMQAAGFAAVEVARQWESTTIIVARK